jgi:Tfp pilus assembly protein PilN
MQATEFDIVVLIEGIPELIRTIAFPSETLGSQEKLQVIKDELSRTIQFYNVNNQEKPINSDIPIFVSGELVHEPGTYQAVSDGLGYAVSPLPSPLDCPPWLDTSRYFINIGLALQGLLSRDGEGPSVVHLNAIPSRYRAKPPSLSKILVPPAVLATIALIVFMVMRIEGAYGDSNLIRQQMNVLNQQLTQTNNERQALTDEIAALEANIAEMKTSSNNFAKALGSLEGQKDGINHNLQAIVENLPSTISLTNFTYTNSTLTVAGKSQNEQAVFDYLNQLDRDDELGEMTLTKLSKGKDEEVDFTLVIRWGGQN